MRRGVVRLLMRVYPRVWRKRYEAEFTALLEAEDGGAGMVVDVMWSGLKERMRATGGTMETKADSFGTMMKHPSAFLPVAMSVVALTMLLVDLAIYGISHEAAKTDEGAVAHLWQILMAGQLPIILFFAVRWMPKAPRQSWLVLGLQAGAVLASMAPVFLLGL